MYLILLARGKQKIDIEKHCRSRREYLIENSPSMNFKYVPAVAFSHAGTISFEEFCSDWGGRRHPIGSLVCTGMLLVIGAFFCAGALPRNYSIPVNRGSIVLGAIAPGAITLGAILWSAMLWSKSPASQFGVCSPANPLPGLRRHRWQFSDRRLEMVFSPRPRH